MEHNLDKDHVKNFNKYQKKNLKAQIEENGYYVEVMPFEVGARGLIPKSTIDFLKYLKLSKKERTNCCRAFAMAAIRGSHRIFMSRNLLKWES
jgi:hypothetical protein